MSTLLGDDESRYVAKQESFCGSARIDLQDLYFDDEDYTRVLDNEDLSHFLDEKNVARLKGIFEVEGCTRLDPENYVPVLISEEQLQDGLKVSGITKTQLLQPEKVPPILQFSPATRLECLHGKHRIAAAKQILLAGDQWWTVDLYSASLPKNIRKDIREDYTNSRNFCDGDIYRQLRACGNGKDSRGEHRWLARLSEGKRKDLKHLTNRDELRGFKDALDTLLPFVGLWPALQIGNFHRILNLKCPEELCNYITHIYNCWDKILGHSNHLKPLLDYHTVKNLQLLNPSLPDDRASIMDMLNRKVIFLRIKDDRVRQAIFQKIASVNCIIPSLYTFFEDTKWLEPCAKIMRSLRDDTKASIRRSFYNSFKRSSARNRAFPVQNKLLTFHEYHGSEYQAIESGYRQLWLFAWRHFPELSAMLPRKDIGKSKPQATAKNDGCWKRLGQLAWELGFRSDKIEGYCKQDSDVMMAQAFIQQARPEMSDSKRLSTANEICEILRRIDGDNRSSREEVMGTIEVPYRSRCGRPHAQAYESTKPSFFLEDVYSTSSSTSYFFVHRDIFYAFFGSVSSLPRPTAEPAETRAPAPTVEPAETRALADDLFEAEKMDLETEEAPGIDVPSDAQGPQVPSRGPNSTDPPDPPDPQYLKLLESYKLGADSGCIFIIFFHRGEYYFVVNEEKLQETILQSADTSYYSYWNTGIQRLKCVDAGNILEVLTGEHSDRILFIGNKSCQGEQGFERLTGATPEERIDWVQQIWKAHNAA